MSQFTSKLIVSPIDEDGIQWELIEPFIYYTEIYGKPVYFEIPDGYQTDFATIPRILWSLAKPYGRHGKAALVHDYLYDNGIVSREDADKIFLEAMTVLKVTPWKRNLMYYSVRLFGKSHYKQS